MAIDAEEVVVTSCRRTARASGGAYRLRLRAEARQFDCSARCHKGLGLPARIEIRPPYGREDLTLPIGVFPLNRDCTGMRSDFRVLLVLRGEPGLGERGAPTCPWRWHRLRDVCRTQAPQLRFPGNWRKKGKFTEIK